jgi:uncharacterized surface protein with fasciclin (FAS1) repeats
MQVIMKKIYGICETGMLLIVGIFGLWLSLTDKYLLLMNENFRWLTFIGSALLVLLGIVVISKPQKRSITNVLSFGLMAMITLLGKPYLPDENAMTPSEGFIQAGLWEQIDQSHFPKKELSSLAIREADKIYENGSSFTTVGVVKRLEGLDGQNSFALMTTYMFCCVADMFGTGFRVPTENLKNMEDGQWVMISGKLVTEDTKIELPNFRFGRAMMASTNQNYYLQAEKIMTYNRIDQLPLLSELIIEGENTQMFEEALIKSGILENLEKAGPYTVFLPVDKAIENLETPLDKMSSRALKKFVKTHIVEGKLFTQDLKDEEELKTLSKKRLQIEYVNGKLQIAGSRILFKNSEARNGTIHYIYPAITTLK